jgi:hypothetical protein
LARLSPAQLASRLAALEVRVESAIVERRSLTLADYPNGPRPSSVVRLSGGGCSGVGENVAFLETEHARFAGFIETWFRVRTASRPLTVGSALATDGTPYERAALQAALIDLGLRQAGLSLADLTGVRDASLRFVASLAAVPEPELAIRRLRREGYRGDLKLDVDPSWGPRALDVVARDSSIVILDFKGRGELALLRELRARCPSALFEDPPLGFEAAELGARALLSRDATLLDEATVAEARARGEAVNLKAPRMGGPLAVLYGLERALAAPSTLNHSQSVAYLGGMFEIDVGRVQARQLAALYCAAAPNDLALNLASATSPRAPSPARIRLDLPGFGAS